MKKILFIAFFAISLPLSASAADSTVTPSTGAPYQFQRQGIFDCNQNGAYAMSVGALSATGGVYVPVADATVELNTGILVYKECVLREVVDREREAATAGFGRKAIIGIETGRNGNRQYVVNQGRELLTNASDPEFLRFLQDGTLQSLNSGFQQPLTRALARNYEARTRAPESVLTCPYQGDLNGILTNPTQSFSWEAFGALADPACNPLGAYYLARDLADSRIAQCEEYLRNQWEWGNGYYDVNSDPQNPCRGNTVTPAITVQESFQTILDSPVHQLENANDIGQMINALYAGMTTQIISDNQGLAGLTKNVGGQPSYLDQVVSEAAQGLRNAAVNVALQNLAAARQVESAYFQTVNAIGNALTTAIGQLRSAEKQCWALVVPKVREAAAGDGTTLDETKIKAATTSQMFSQPVIDSQIAPLASSTLAKISASKNALRLIDQLIAGVTNTASLDAQRLSLQQLDSLIAQKLLHIEPDLNGPNGVVKQLDSVQSAVLGSDGLVQTTIKAWADSPDPSVGWCNINNPAVVQGWKDRWKKI